MSLRNLAGKLAKTFNWLAEPPQRHMTLGEFVPWATDNMLNFPGPPRQLSRAARVLERGVFAAGLVTAAVIAVAEGSTGGPNFSMGAAMGPLVTLPFIFKGMGYSAALVADRTLKMVANKMNAFENFTRGQEFKAQGKQNLPRRLR